MQVHHGKDEYPVRFDAVQDAEWEAVRETAADIAIEDRPGGRVGENSLDGGVHFQREIQAETGLAPFVIPDSLLEFRIRFGVE